MHDLLFNRLLAAALPISAPEAGSLLHDSIQNLVTRSFLLSLWWKELAAVTLLLCASAVVAVRVARRIGAVEHTTTDPHKRQRKSA